jgi:hypothetical protein
MARIDFPPRWLVGAAALLGLAVCVASLGARVIG